MNQRNYQKELEQILHTLEEREKTPTLLLHSCCAPCSSYVLEYLSRFFSITVYYYNPNITDSREYRHRVEEQRRLIHELPALHRISFSEGDYEPECFFEMARGRETQPEGGARCYDCYRLRLTKAAQYAKAQGFDFFTTTLSISPMKRADWLNELGAQLADSVGIAYLFSDFKKRGGYQRSIELSAVYGLYRQDYCGCVYSKLEANARKIRREEMNRLAEEKASVLT